jgi:hypothetical protein
MDGLSGDEMFPARTLKEAATKAQAPRKTWRYFAQTVIQEEDPEKLTDLISCFPIT